MFKSPQMCNHPQDTQTTIAELRAQIRHFVAARAWEEKHTAKDLAMSIAIEAAELMEHFQFRTDSEVIAALADPAVHFEVADELADVLIYCLSFANSVDIDVSDAIARKLARNEKRFPPRA